MTRALQCAEGCGLLQAIRASPHGEGLPETAVRCIVRQMVLALDHLHQQGFVWVVGRLGSGAQKPQFFSNC